MCARCALDGINEVDGRGCVQSESQCDPLQLGQGFVGVKGVVDLHCRKWCPMSPQRAHVFALGWRWCNGWGNFENVLGLSEDANCMTENA